MQFVIDVQPDAGGAGWTVSILDRQGAALKTAAGLPIVRRMMSANVTPDYPLPAGGIADLHAVLGAAATIDTLRAMHEAIVARTAVDGDIQRFGQYLFETLLGSEAWTTILQTAKQDPIELVLSWDTQQLALNRLPWEMVHGRGRFLAQESAVAIIRRVQAAQTLPTFASPPKVLFVVGTELYKDVIEPGAEYLRLLQGLKARDLDLSLRTLLVLKCTIDRLQAALEEFTPDVVHFICHGQIDQAGSCYLELVDAKNPAAATPLYSGALVTLLRQTHVPSIAVLSACYTAGVEYAGVGQITMPFAADLVEHGVPMVVGMGGRIADQACRLFTRQFYESLLVGGDIAHATADGRRAAIIHGGTDPATSSDWALPVIFFASGIGSTRLPLALNQVEQTWQGFATDFRAFRKDTDPVFCDRLEIMEQFDLLTSEEKAQKRVGDRDVDLQTLAIDVPEPDTADKFGRTWLLREFAVKTIQDGHVPCLVCKGSEGWVDDDRIPGDVDQLLRAIQQAAGNTRDRFDVGDQIPTACPLLETLLNLPDGAEPPPTMPADIRNVVGDPATRGVRRKGVALRLDLLELLDRVAAKRPAADVARAKLVLLIDDMHRMGHRAVSDFFNHLTLTSGLRAAKSRIRLVIAFSSKPRTAEEPSVKIITDSIRSWMARVELGRFRPTLEERQAYQHYLLHWKNEGKLRPLVPDAAMADFLFKRLASEVAGVPSNLPLKAPPVIRTLIDMPKGLPTVLRDADDLVALVQSRTQTVR